MYLHYFTIKCVVNKDRGLDSVVSVVYWTCGSVPNDAILKYQAIKVFYEDGEGNCVSYPNLEL